MPRKDGRIEKGQSLRSAISARAWNRAQDAADIVLGVTPGVMAGASVPIERAANIVLVRNDSGQPVPPMGVLVISGIAISPVGGSLDGTNEASNRARQVFSQPVLIGSLPTSTSVTRIGIAVESVAVGAIGRFAIGGVVPCKVKVLTSGHQYARARVNDVTQLISSGCGPVKLLWAETTVGEDKWAVGVL